jgi:hypothetical protein
VIWRFQRCGSEFIDASKFWTAKESGDLVSNTIYTVRLSGCAGAANLPPQPVADEVCGEDGGVWNRPHRFDEHEAGGARVEVRDEEDAGCDVRGYDAVVRDRNAARPGAS